MVLFGDRRSMLRDTEYTGKIWGMLPGRGSEETWMEAPVVSLISLILTPSFPMIAPHWLLGTSRFRCKSNSSSLSPDRLPDSLRSGF